MNMRAIHKKIAVYTRLCVKIPTKDVDFFIIHYYIYRMIQTTNRKKKKFVKLKKTVDPSATFDYKDTHVIRRFMTEHGKIIPSRVSGASAQQQRELKIAIKRARVMSLIGYDSNIEPKFMT